MDQPRKSRRKRSDAAENRAHILRVATGLLVEHPRASMSEVADAAHVSRGTLYRHFPGREELLAAVDDGAREAAESVSSDELRAPGQVARASPTPLSVADVLNKVPPHLLGDQIVAEAQRIPEVTSAAIYLVDLDGVNLVRLAGNAAYPQKVMVPLAVGTEVPLEGLPAMRARVAERLPGTAAAPLSLRGRALGMLVAVGCEDGALLRLAYEAAAALALGAVYSDALDAARRVRATSPAAELQQNLLPPRIVRTDGALIAGNVLPGYEIGGDWFDYAENTTGTWLGTADATGSGAKAAALAAIALGAFRSARHQELDLAETVELMHEAVREVAEDGATVEVTIGHWVPPTSTFSWVSCGELGPIVVSPDGEGLLTEWQASPPLGSGAGLGDIEPQERRLQPGDRLILASDGVLDRTLTSQEPFGITGVVDAVRDAPAGSAAGAVSLIESTIRKLASGKQVDDATLVVLVPVLRGELP